MKNLPNYDIEQIVSPEQGMLLIRSVIAELRAMNSEMDYSSSAEKTQFIENVQFAKRYYERVERLIIEKESP